MAPDQTHAAPHPIPATNPGTHPDTRPGARPDAIVVNGRYRVHRITGVQRYAHEIVRRLSPESTPDSAPKGTHTDGYQSAGEGSGAAASSAAAAGAASRGRAIELISPESAKGALGHLWEQTVLPATCRGRLLWNPSGGGPAFYPRQVVTFHDIFPVEHPEWYGGNYGRWYRFLMTRLAKESLHLIAVSEYTRSRLLRLTGRDPAEITVIPNGLTTGCARASSEQIAAAHQALHLPTRRYVLSLSSLEKRKNLRTVLEAWARVHTLLPEDIWLVLAGPVADERVYGRQNLPTGLPRVLYTGYVPEEHLAGLYSGASLFVFPSIAEGFGLPLLEAMGCGLRSITSNTTAMPEVGGDVVSYVDPLDAAGLAEAIRAEIAAGASPDRPFLPAIERARGFCWDRAAAQTRAVLEAAAMTS